MLKKISHFVQYHNFFTLGVTLVFAGTTASFAASPDLRAGVISQNQTVRSVDNTYVINTDFDTYDMGLKVQTVTEDADKYYVDYTYNTIEPVDYVWKQVSKTGSMKVSKKELEGRDLGLYVADQLGQKIDQELAYLKDFQKEQRKEGLSQKVVTTEYSGLVGRFLETDEKVFDGYQPVKPEAEKIENTNIAAAITPVTEVAPAPQGGSVSYGAPAETLLTREEVRVLIQDAVRNLLSQNKQTETVTPVSIPTQVVSSPEPAIVAPVEVVPVIIEPVITPETPVVENIPEEIAPAEQSAPVVEPITEPVVEEVITPAEIAPVESSASTTEPVSEPAPIASPEN